jgi:hypothetical protein
MTHKTYPHIAGVLGDEGENPGVLAITATLDPGTDFPEDCRIVVGSPTRSDALPGYLPDLGGFAMGIAGAERLVATLQQAISDVRAATGRMITREVWCNMLGFTRIGRIDSVGRRSLWLKEGAGALELRAGREGDDAHVRITADNPQFREIDDVMSAARFAAEWEDSTGLTLCPMGIEAYGYETSEDTVDDEPLQSTTVFYFRDAGRDQRFRVIVRHRRYFAVQFARGEPSGGWEMVNALAVGITADHVMALLLARLANYTTVIQPPLTGVRSLDVGDVL